MNAFRTCCLLWACACGPVPCLAREFRPPAVPLAVNDSRLSLWSPADALTDAETMHWSRDAQPLSIVAETGGRTWRLCGLEPQDVPAARQVSVRVGCTRTTFVFDADGRRIELVFATPVIPGDWDVFSRPVTYVTVRGAAARVSVSPAFATDDDAAAMVTNVTAVAGRRATAIGRAEPKYLETGDRRRPNGGRVWLVEGDGCFLLAYDAVKDMTFLGREVRAWWRRDGKPFEAMLAEALRDAPQLLRETEAFDAKMRGRFLRTGGGDYATLAELAWRQSFGACSLVASPEGEMMYFSVEHTSNGCVGTVDIFYPQFPHLMLAGADLVRATLRPMMAYASSDKWPFPFAPHDLGGFPRADGQWYGWSYGKDPTGAKAKVDRLMPVEECGNMLLCLAALAKIEGSAAFAGARWDRVKGWADYLKAKGFDPENQLCTDDFAGHLAHNANLSIKSILAFGAFARLAEMRGEPATAAEFRTLAEASVGKWLAAAKRPDGKGTRLAFDRPESWSQKYNLVWDRLLDLKLFPPELGATEVESYLARRDLYGTPLDSRVHWCKVDWLVWCASMARTRHDFASLIAPVVAFLDATPDRVAFPDLYYTETATLTRYGKAPDAFTGFNARPVVGAVYLPCLIFGEKDGCHAAKEDIAKWDPLMAAKSAVVDTNGVKWIDGRYLPIEGRPYDDVENYYDRLPKNVTAAVNGGVRSMKHHTSGMLFRFRTDSKFLVIRMKSYSGWHAMPHMTEVGTSGWDVYRYDAGAKAWRFVASNHLWGDVRGRPGWREKRIGWKPGDACIVNLPLYNGVAGFELGIDPAAKVEALGPRASGVNKPVVFYGTSITHGGCCTRPGLGFVNWVGRDLDVPVVGLGFSGSGVMEYELSDHIARIDASCYVLDCLWNMSFDPKGKDGRSVQRNYEPFIRNLRAKRPDVPIIMAEGCDVFFGEGVRSAAIAQKDAFMRALYEKLIAEGWKNLHYLPKDKMYSGDFEGTVDGSHPNDLGMQSMKNAFGAAVREALHLR